VFKLDPRGTGVPDLAVVNAGELAICGGEDDSLGIIEDGAMLVHDGRVSWFGTTGEYRRKSVGRPGRVVDARGGLVTPGFVDPHTHLAFAGSREDELERKISGESYVSILEGGGGIARTVRETRKASTEEILSQSAGRLAQLVRNGVTTVEVKSGYGQTVRDELKLMEVILRLGKGEGAEVVPTFLGLHSRPPEFRKDREYVTYSIREMLPAAAKLRPRAAFSDCFCEEGVFSAAECRRYLKASKELGFDCKIHADEFADSGGASLAAELGCVSADHLGKSPPESLELMGRKGVTAVLLPGTSVYSGIPFAEAKEIMSSGCQVALGTDLSPNSWIESPQFVMSLACNGLKMTPAQALLGFTRNAAKALGRRDVGTLALGSRADFVVHSIPSHRFLAYRVGGSYVRGVFRAGRQIFSADPS
jgi:imidazolonepropionase